MGTQRKFTENTCVVTFPPARYPRIRFASGRISFRSRETFAYPLAAGERRPGERRPKLLFGRGTRVHVRNVVSIRADALPDRLRPSSSADERADESSSAEGNVVKNSLPTRGIDRRAPCNYVLFTPHHAPVLPRRPGVMRTRKKVDDESARAIGAFSLSSFASRRGIASARTKRQRKRLRRRLIEEIWLTVTQACGNLTDGR